MSILVMCPSSSCSQLFSVPEADAGKEVSCPACGAVQVIAGASSSPQPDGRQQLQSRIPEPPPLPPPADRAGAALPDLSPLEDERADSRAGPGGEKIVPHVELAKDRQVDLTPEQYTQPAQPAAPASAEQASPAKADIEEELDNIFDADMPSVLADGWSGSSESLESAAYGVLAYKSVKRIIFAGSFLGMVLGLLSGLHFFAGSPIPAAYVGAGLGWTGGFIFALVLALTVGKDSSREQSPAIGSSPVADYLKAGSYALTNKSSIYLITMLLVAVDVLFVGVSHLLTTFSSALQPFRLILISLCVIAGFFTFAYCLQFFLSVIDKTVLLSPKAPGLPASWGVKNIVIGLKALAMLVVYVLPIFTLPLLPLALLMLRGPGWRSVLNPARAVRAMRKHAEDFMMLWLVLLLWFSGMVLSIVAAAIGLWKLTALIPSRDASSMIVPSVLLSAVAVAIVGAICCAFCLVIFRCIGLFGRRHSADFVR